MYVETIRVRKEEHTVTATDAEGNETTETITKIVHEKVKEWVDDPQPLQQAASAAGVLLTQTDAQAAADALWARVATLDEKALQDPEALLVAATSALVEGAKLQPAEARVIADHLVRTYFAANHAPREDAYDGVITPTGVPPYVTGVDLHDEAFGGDPTTVFGQRGAALAEGHRLPNDTFNLPAIAADLQSRYLRSRSIQDVSAGIVSVIGAEAFAEVAEHLIDSVGLENIPRRTLEALIDHVPDDSDVHDALTQHLNDRFGSTREEAYEMGRDIVIDNTWTYGVATTGVIDDLIEFVLDQEHVQPEVGSVVAGALSALTPEQAAEVAHGVVSALPPAALDNIGRQGLLALSRALDPSSPEYAAIEAEFQRRQVSIANIDGVRVIGDEVDPANFALAEAYIEAFLARNPDLAERLDGVVIVVSPDNETITDQEAFFTLEPGKFGRRLPSGRQYREAYGLAVNGTHIFLPESDFSPTNPRQFRVLDHELTHAAHHRYLEEFDPSDPLLIALLDPATSPMPTTVDGILEAAFEERMDAGLILNDYAQTNEAEWLAQAGMYFLTDPSRVPTTPVHENATWIRDNDPALYDLLTVLFGPSPQHPLAPPPTVSPNIPIH